MNTADFDYDLPPALIAQTPLEPRDSSRLLVLHRAEGSIVHGHFRDLPAYLRPGDLLVANDSRVIPARLCGRKRHSGGRVELLLIAPRAAGQGEQLWEALVRPGRRLPEGTCVEFDGLADTRHDPSAPGAGRPDRGPADAPGEGGGLCAPPVGARGGPKLCGYILGRTEWGGRLVRFEGERDVGAAIAAQGVVPLPPYIRTPLADGERYQTVYARVDGSVAAPTAGLHFTPRLIERLLEAGVQLAFVTLHIGLDTFRPVQAADPTRHAMHSEFAELTPEVAALLTAARRSGRRIVAVGTTAVRVLESAASEDGVLSPYRGCTKLFIYPGYHFKAVDALITNFHLPRSTLLMLVSAFAGRERMLGVYAEAAARGYRFYSLGDAMLIV